MPALNAAEIYSPSPFAYGRRGATLPDRDQRERRSLRDGQRHIRQTGPGENSQGYAPGQTERRIGQSGDVGRVTGFGRNSQSDGGEGGGTAHQRPAWCMQEKKDGKRRCSKERGGHPTGINKKGLLVGLPSPLSIRPANSPAMSSLTENGRPTCLYLRSAALGADSLVSRPYRNVWPS